jgi:hypothetical protein
MHYSQSDYEAAGINHFKKKKKVVISKPTVGTNAAAVSVNGQPMVKVSTMSKKQKKKAKRKAIVKKVGKGLKKVAKKVVKISAGLAKAPMLAPLIPLKPMMKKALKKNGFNAPSKTQDLAEAFYNHVIRGQHYDMPVLKRDGYQDNLITVEIVGQILKFVKDALGKKKAKKTGSVPGVELSPTEKLVADESEAVIKKIEVKAEEAGVSIAPDVTTAGSNSKESSSSGVAKNDESEAGDRAARKGKKGGKKSGGNSFMSGNTPLYIASAGIAALVLLKK